MKLDKIDKTTKFYDRKVKPFTKLSTFINTQKYIEKTNPKNLMDIWKKQQIEKDNYEKTQETLKLHEKKQKEKKKFLSLKPKKTEENENEDNDLDTDFDRNCLLFEFNKKFNSDRNTSIQNNLLFVEKDDFYLDLNKKIKKIEHNMKFENKTIDKKDVLDKLTNKEKLNEVDAIIKKSLFAQEKEENIIKKSEQILEEFRIKSRKTLQLLSKASNAIYGKKVQPLVVRNAILFKNSVSTDKIKNLNFNKKKTFIDIRHKKLLSVNFDTDTDRKISMNENFKNDQYKRNKSEHIIKKQSSHVTFDRSVTENNKATSFFLTSARDSHKFSLSLPKNYSSSTKNVRKKEDLIKYPETKHYRNRNNKIFTAIGNYKSNIFNVFQNIETLQNSQNKFYDKCKTVIEDNALDGLKMTIEKKRDYTKTIFAQKNFKMKNIFKKLNSKKNKLL